jgi:hypothetical protein
LAQEISSLCEFEKSIPQMKNVLNRHYERFDIEKRLGLYGGQLQYAETNLTEEVKQKTHALNILHEQMTTLKSEWGSAYDQLSLRLIKAKNEVNSCDKNISQIDQQYAVYEEQNMDQKASDLDNLGQFMEDAAAVNSRYMALIENVKQEENALNRQLNEAHLRYDKIRKSAQKKLDDERISSHTKEQAYFDKRETISNREQVDIEAVRVQARPERDELKESIASAKVEASRGGSTEEERTSQTILQERIEGLDREVENKRQILEKKQSALDSAKVQQDASNDDFSRAKRSLTAENDRLDQLHKLAFAEDGTWLKKLRDSHPGWVMHLGKVINPTLLQRKDLHAEYVVDDLETIFGWSINMHAIATPQYAESEDQLRAEYVIQEALVVRAKDQLAEFEIACKKASKLFKSANDECKGARQELRQVTHQKEEAQRHYQVQNRQIDEAIDDRRRAAKKELSRLNTEFEVFEQALKQRLGAVKSRYINERSEMHGAWSIEQSRMLENITRLSNELDSGAKSYECRLQEIKGDFNKACSEKGIDGSTIASAKRVSDDSQDKVNFVRGSAGEVNAYRNWLQAEWCARDGLISRLCELQADHEVVKVEIEERQRAYKRQLDAHGKNEKQINSHLVTLNGQIEQINMLGPRFGFYMKDADTDKLTIPFELLVQEILSLLDNNDELKNKLIDDIQRVNSKIDQFAETQIAQAWQRAKDNLRHQLGFDDPFDRNFLINLPQALEVFIDEEVISIKSARIESLRGIGKGLTDFFEKLRVIHNRIKDQSRKITASISENMKIDALSSIRLSLTSRIDSLDYWKSLQDFSKSWYEWREAGESGLPDQQFLDEMAVLINALQSIRSGDHLRDYFDLHIRMVENGNERIIKNDRQLEDSTSDGLKYLALCVIFIAISRQLCPDRDVKLHWPIDELGILHGENISRLFQMLDQGGIVMVGGFPSEDPVLLRNFKHRQVIDFKKGIRVIDIPESSLRERALARQNLEANK